MGDSFHGCVLPWAANTLYITLARNDLKNDKNNRTTRVVLAVVCSPAPLPPLLSEQSLLELLDLVMLLLLGLLDPWTQLPHRLESSPFHRNPPPNLFLLTNLIHSNLVQACFLSHEPSLETLVALSEVFLQLLLIHHYSPMPRPVEVLLLLSMGLSRLSQELQAFQPDLDLGIM
jgi:hypothetical protein